MKKALLRRYRYDIPASALVISGLCENIRRSLHTPTRRFHILFDFEEGQLRVKADRHLVAGEELAAVNSLYAERFLITAEIIPRRAVRLRDGVDLIFYLTGSVKEEGRNAKCTGLLIITKSGDENPCNGWVITVYLYEEGDACEINFNVPVYAALPEDGVES